MTLIKFLINRIFLLASIVFISGSTLALAQDSSFRKVAITIDDLPTISLLNTPAQQLEITRKIIKSLTDHKAPAIGFVNEGKLYNEKGLDPLQINLLNMWLNAGLELGNHSYSHPSYHKTDTSIYFSDILKGQLITDSLLSARDQKVKYFRHPFLHTGNSMVKQDALRKFLRNHNLQVAPVTVDNSDWIYARAYDNAILAGDSTLMKEIGASYVQYMEDYFNYYESQSVQLLGYEVAQTLLLHANTINADYLDELLTMLAARNYKVVSLYEALQDKAYQQSENFIGDRGISWLHRWALTQGRSGKFFEGEPETPDFVVKTADLK